MYNPQEWQNELLAQQIRELERINPKKARKLMFENPRLLDARKAVALAALQRRTYAGQ